MPLSSNLDFVALGGHTRPTLPLLLVHIHARYEELLELMGTHMPHRFLDSSNGPYFVCVPRGLLSSSQPKALSGGSCPLGSSPLFGLLPFVSFVRRFSFDNCEGALQVGGCRVSSVRLMAHA